MTISMPSPHYQIQEDLADFVAFVQACLWFEDGKWNINKSINGADFIDAVSLQLEAIDCHPMEA